MIHIRCHDCGWPYGGPGWMDAVVPNDVWAKISPTGDEGGILCVTCMARRCEELGLDAVPLKITSGPFALAPRIEGDEVSAAIRALRFWRSNARLTGPKRDAVRRLHGKLLLAQQAMRTKGIA